MSTATTRPGVRPSSLSDTGVMRLAAIDVGSNSIHMVVAQADADGGLTVLWRLKEMVGLGRMSFPSHRLSREAMERAMLTLRRFQQEALRRECEKILAIATSAVREATNGGEFIERAQQELGLRVRVISAKEEARLIYLAVRHAVDLKGGPHLMVDVGGGSVEFIVGDRERALLLESRKLGAARMTAKFVKSDPIDAGDLRRLLTHFQQELEPLMVQIRSYEPVRVIGTSGTLENLAVMCGSGGTSNGQSSDAVIERRPFTRILDQLLESSSKERARMRALDEQRRDQILAGALLANELFRRLDLKEIRLCKAALREGILIDYLSRHLPELEIRRQVPDPRRRSVLDLARRCDWFQSHREQVTRLCLQLFDQLKGLHGLGRRERELIEYGSLLHEIGWYIGREGHHRHSMYLVLHGDLKGFSKEEIRIIACIARYHRKSPPKRGHQPFALLSSKDQRMVQLGAALLRMADGLDRSHCGAVSNVRCRVARHQVAVRVEGRGDVQLEVWAARRKKKLLEEFSGRSVLIAAR